MSACLYFLPEAYSTLGPKLMGRNAAGESFLKGFLRHSRASEFWLQVQDRQHAAAFVDAATKAGRGEPIKAVDNNSLGALERAGVVYHPGPGIGEHAFQRATFGHGAWSLCGITHTTSSAGAMDALVNLITAPIQPWDAVICTSLMVKNNVERVLQAQTDYLQDRLGVTKLVLPQLPVIPLGIDVQDFSFTEAQKAAARDELGVDEQTLVVLFAGRLSFHAKAHPLAMYQALEAAAKTAGKNVVLVECGWHANEYIENAYAEAASQVCPNIRVVTLDGRKPEDRQRAWAGADIFCSLSDNIQETFGIVPIEAMAAGLPVVVSDWDGYKDTVRDGVDGFRIPTLMPKAGLGTDLALRHALGIDNYDMYCGHTCSLVAVDVPATANALAELFQSPELRYRMGQAGQRRAREVYDWAVIIPQYEALWTQLTQIRQEQASERDTLPHPWPARLDPFYAFASYPSRLLTSETVLTLTDADAEKAVTRVLDLRKLSMVGFAKEILPTQEEIEDLLAIAAAGPSNARALISNFPDDRQPFVFRSLAWLLKLGVLKVAS